ncbi:MAG: VanZ family protein [Pirellulales bacterium]
MFTLSPQTHTLVVRRFGLIMRYSSLFYWCLLSLGLLTSNPSAAIQRSGFLQQTYHTVQPAVHFLGFMLLTCLVMAGTWSVSRRVLLISIAVYAGLTELLQGLIPSRTPEWADFWQDLAGMAVGLAIWWIACRATRLLLRAAPGGSPAA